MTNHLLTIEYWSNKLHLCSLLKGAGVELKIIDEIIGGMPSWTEEANCKGADADLFFPERGASTRKAKAICRACTVQDECLEYAVEQSEKFGIWGGLSERERRRIKRQRAAEFDVRDVG